MQASPLGRACACARTQAKGQFWLSFAFCLVFWERISTWTWNLPFQLYKLDSKLQEYINLCLPSTRVKDMYHHTYFLFFICECWGSELRYSCLPGTLPTEPSPQPKSPVFKFLNIYNISSRLFMRVMEERCLWSQFSPSTM